MLQTTEVDGVPTLLAPSSGPVNAGLIFRVGQADETLASHGITHLVEHLALHDSGLSDYHYNGQTASVYTHFHMQGSESDLVKYFGGVCDSLAGLPMHRLETEKAILRTESRSRGGNPTMPLWRYGAQGFGLPSYPEWGLFRLGPDDLRRWTETYFTRENAVLWIAGDRVPPGLTLRLPSGQRRPLPTPTSALPDTPAYFRGDESNVVLTAVVPRGSASSTYAGILERELYRSLRQEGGFSYTASASYDPRGDEFAELTAYADALPEKQNAVLGGFIDVLAKLRVGRIDPQDLNAVRLKALEGINHPDVEAARLPGLALNLLTGQPNRTLAELRDDMNAVTVEDVHQVAIAAAGTTLLQTPCGTTADWAGFAAAPTASSTAVTGPSMASLESEQSRIVIGSQGISAVRGDNAVTVHYQSCAAVLAWPDGARRLVGQDGMVLHIEPTLWAANPALLAGIDHAVDPAVVLPMPARDSGSIPQPQAPDPKPASVPSGPVSSGRNLIEILAMILFGGLAVVMAFIGLIFTLYVAGEETEALDWELLTCSWVTALIFAVPVFLLKRTRSRRLRS